LPVSQSRLEPIVRQWDPLLESLIGGAPEDRAAIWGQCEQESNFNPAAIEKPGTNIGGIGLIQWTGQTEHNPRRRNFERFAAERSKPWQDVETQVRFIAHELKDPEAYAHAWHQITRIATTPRAKVETAMALYLAPARWQEEIRNPGSTTAGLPRRMRGAAWALAVIMAAKRGDGKVSDTSGTDIEQHADQGDVLLNWIKKNEVPFQTAARAILVAHGVPGGLVDGVFAIVNQIDLQTAFSLLQHVNLGGLFSDLKSKGVQLPSFSSLLSKLHVGG
jgi:Phage tail lysozyme